MATLMLRPIYQVLRRVGTRLGEAGFNKIPVIPKIYHSLQESFAPDIPEHAVIDYFGYRLHINPQDEVSRQLFLMNEFEPEVERVITDVVERGDTCIDIGAHVGHHSFVMRSSVGDTGEVHAFEPHPETRQTLLRSVEENNFDNLIVYSEAMSNEVGEAVLTDTDDGNTGGATLKKKRGEASEFLVEKSTLRKFLIENSIDTVGLIKIDVEGHELSVIKGLGDYITRVEHMLIEVHTDRLHEDEIDALYCVLSKHGDVYSLDDGHSLAKSEFHCSHPFRIRWKNE